MSDYISLHTAMEADLRRLVRDFGILDVLGVIGEIAISMSETTPEYTLLGMKIDNLLDAVLDGEIKEAYEREQSNRNI